MNSITNKDYEIYDMNNFMKSSDLDNKLINKNIDNYFNDLINKPIEQTNKIINKSNFSFEKIYDEYIEHNLLFIVLYFF